MGIYKKEAASFEDMAEEAVVPTKEKAVVAEAPVTVNEPAAADEKKEADK